MRDPEISFCRWQLLFFSVVLLGNLVTTRAGEPTDLRRLFPKPAVQPFQPVNSTFSTDLKLPLPVDQHHFSEPQERQQRVGEALGARWYRDHLALPQSAPVTPAASSTDPANDPANNSQRMKPSDNMRFQWKPALSQAMTFLWIQHAFRFATEPGTRAEMRGPFFKDWIASVKRTKGWRDGDPFIVNYIGHPMQGSVTNYIYVHNDPKSIPLEAGFNKAYFKSRLKAMLFSTIYSTQFELGPLGEAAWGNVGRVPTKTAKYPMAYVDLVVTPTMGTMWMMGEDWLDRLLVKRMEEHVENRVVRLLVRSFLNPSRSFANALRGRYPWYRDGRRL